MIHILMGAKIRIESNGMLYINVCKKRVQKPLRNKSTSDLTSFWWILMVTTCEHDLKLKDLNAKMDS